MAAADADPNSMETPKGWKQAQTHEPSRGLLRKLSGLDRSKSRVSGSLKQRSSMSVLGATGQVTSPFTNMSDYVGLNRIKIGLKSD